MTTEEIAMSDTLYDDDPDAEPRTIEVYGLLPVKPTYRCVVHGAASHGCEGPCEHEVEPTPEDLAEELVNHLAGDHGFMCGYCYEEHEIRWHGIEGVNLHDQHVDDQVADSCTCRDNPVLRRAVVRYTLSGYCPVCDGDEGRHLSGCPFLDYLCEEVRR